MNFTKKEKQYIEDQAGYLDENAKVYLVKSTDDEGYLVYDLHSKVAFDRSKAQYTIELNDNTRLVEIIRMLSSAIGSGYSFSRSADGKKIVATPKVVGAEFAIYDLEEEEAFSLVRQLRAQQVAILKKYQKYQKTRQATKKSPAQLPNDSLIRQRMQTVKEVIADGYQEITDPNLIAVHKFEVEQGFASEDSGIRIPLKEDAFKPEDEGTTF